MSDGQANLNQPRNNSRTIFYIFLLLILFGINIYLYIKYNQRNNETQKLTEQVASDSVQYTDLNLKYQEALVNIESYKGQNGQLDSIIAVKEKTLMDIKNSYTSLQKKGKIDRAEFDKQVAGMNDIVSDLQNQISVLKGQLNIAINKNDSLGQSLASQINTNSELENINTNLTRKVSLASLLIPTSITAAGVRIKSSGKEDETDNSKKLEKIRICWTIPENPVAEAGEKTFYVRIINPEQITLNAGTAGSGVINNAMDGTPIQYSMPVTVYYEQKTVNTCSYWSQATPYNKGVYTVNIYQDGYLLGGQKLELK